MLVDAILFLPIITEEPDFFVEEDTQSVARVSFCCA